jgi:alginate O-acetyltransferase complex protein AlgI
LNFLIWGLYYAIILIIEKFLLQKYLEKLPKVFRHLYALILIIIGWTIFAIEDISILKDYLGTMFSINSYQFIDSTFLYFIRNYGVLFIIATIFSIPFKFTKTNKIINILKAVIYIILFIVTLSLIISDTYNPFLYFRF